MKILITGGAGFIGINAAKHYLDRGESVIIYDNFSRRGGRENIAWLKSQGKKGLTIVEGDVRDAKKIKKPVSGVDVVLHLAGQVAVTTSVLDPRDDFESNLLGTFNVLEAIRQSSSKPALLYSSTNKVYGGLEDLAVREEKTRYSFVNHPFGVSEVQPLDFHSPYGCSKGAADQYVRDYHRIYDLDTIVFRQSCIYGTRQFGIEDQGWVAWFIIALSKGKNIQIYGNGKQVRDILFIDDLLAAYDLALGNIKKTRGGVYNIGGGPHNTISIWHEFRPILEELFARKIPATFAAIRPGDQPIFIADIRKAHVDLGWKPKVGVKEGISRLYSWISANTSIFTL